MNKNYNQAYYQLLRLTEEEISKLNVEKAFELIDSYENKANDVKGRIWTITAWILTINAGLIAFCFDLYQDKSDSPEFLIFVFVACSVGVGLCIYLEFLINDQGNHIKGYHTSSNRIGAWNQKVAGLAFKRYEFERKTKPPEFYNLTEFIDKRKKECYEAPFPTFCNRLLLLSRLFLLVFGGIFLLMLYLSK